MDTKLPYLEIRGPGDFTRIRGFIEANKALGIEGYERMPEREREGVPRHLLFMLGYFDEDRQKAVFVAGVRTAIWEFSEHIEDRVRRALLLGPPIVAVPVVGVAG